MNLITLAQACNQCKVDEGDDDAQVILYADAAEAAIAAACNRNLYATDGALAAAVANIPGAMATAAAAYTAAIEAADLLEEPAKGVATRLADHALAKATIAQENVMWGIVAGKDLVAAVLLTLGHLYDNRKGVVSGQGSTAVELPLGAEHLAYRHRRLGGELP